MSRTYDASRRAEQARQTRRRILDAAVALHRRGITAYQPLAEAAGVSLPTVRKYFPNREAIFAGCTAHFFDAFTPPDLEGAAAVSDPLERLTAVVTEMGRVHEETHDLVWHNYALVSESPAVAAALAALGSLCAAAADVVVDGPGLALAGDAREAARHRVRALLDTLTYRAFRVHAGFDVEATRGELNTLVGFAVGVLHPKRSGGPHDEDEHDIR